jgi:hypothetical protein
MAIVIGGIMAGLLTARVLADYYEHVALVERDGLAPSAGSRRCLSSGAAPCCAASCVYRPAAFPPTSHSLMQHKSAPSPTAIPSARSLSAVAHTAAINQHPTRPPDLAVQARLALPNVYRPLQPVLTHPGPGMSRLPIGPASRPAGALLSRPTTGVPSSVQTMKRTRDDDDSDYVPPQCKKQKRFHIPTNVVEQVVRSTGHRRVHFDPTKFRNVYTCPGCGRPLGSDEVKSGKLVLTKRNYTSKSGKLHPERALQLDHYPI